MDLTKLRRRARELLGEAATEASHARQKDLLVTSEQLLMSADEIEAVWARRTKADPGDRNADRDKSHGSSERGGIDIETERIDLAKADEDIAQGERRVAAHLRLIGAAKRAGHDRVLAEKVLATLQETLSIWRSHRQLIRETIARRARRRGSRGDAP